MRKLSTLQELAYLAAFPASSADLHLQLQLLVLHLCTFSFAVLLDCTTSQKGEYPSLSVSERCILFCKYSLSVSNNEI